MAFIFHALQIIQYDLQIPLFSLKFSSFFTNTDDELFKLLLIAARRAIHLYHVRGFVQGQAQALSTQDQPQAGAVGWAIYTPGTLTLWVQIALFLVEANCPRGNAEFARKIADAICFIHPNIPGRHNLPACSKCMAQGYITFTLT